MDLKNILDELNLKPEQLLDIQKTLQKNPMGIMSLMQKYGIDMATLKKIADKLLSQPEVMQELMQKTNLPKETLYNFKNKLN